MESSAPEPLALPTFPPSPGSGDHRSRDRGPRDNYVLHAALLLLALLTTSLAGAELVGAGQWWPAEGVRQLEWWELSKGLPFGLCFLAFLGTHEMGHYLTARRLGVSASLPYFLPIFLPFLDVNIGSLGAVIRLRERPDSTQKYFDIGIAGPLAGVVVAVGVLVVGFLTLPPVDYLYAIHPSYADLFDGMPSDRQIEGALAGGGPLLAVGDSLLFRFLAWAFADPARLPSRYELYHYPLLFAGYLGLFFTALNLLPVGQLDGGHVVYGLIGRTRAAVVARLTVLALITYGGVGLTQGAGAFWPIAMGFYLLYLAYLLPRVLGTTRWWAVLGAMVAIVLLQAVLEALLEPHGFQLVWLVYSLLLVRVIGLDHPPALIEAPLDARRRLLGWLALVIFVLCFTPEPLYMVVPEATKGVFVLR